MPSPPSTSAKRARTNMPSPTRPGSVLRWMLEPDLLAASTHPNPLSNPKVQIYSPDTNKVRKTITRFKDIAYSKCFG